jgi:hypothetical protein
MRKAAKEVFAFCIFSAAVALEVYALILWFNM